MTPKPVSSLHDAAAHPYFTWLLLTLPALFVGLVDLMNSSFIDPFGYTGRLSCWLLALTLAVTPLKYLFGTRPWVQWLRRNRRYLGVASLAYAAIHTLYFLKNASAQRLIDSFVHFDILTGWIAFAIMAVLAWASRDSIVRRMGTGWKRLHRWVYPAALATFLHWALTGYGYRPIEITLVCLPIFALEIWRYRRYRLRLGATG